MSFDDKQLFVVVPAFNEQAMLGEVVAELRRSSYNVVVVDDGSSIPVSNIIGPSKGLYILRHKCNLGQGASLQTGIEFALREGADYIISFDADGQHLVADIPTMLMPLQTGNYDVALGSRFIREGSHNAPAGRKKLLKTGRLVNYLFTGLFLSDAHNGFRGFTREAAQRIKIRENRMAHASEILSIIRKEKMKFLEVPVTVNYTPYSKKKGQSSLNSIRIFFDLVLHKLFE